MVRTPSLLGLQTISSRFVAMVTVLALLVFPIVAALTHGPAAAVMPIDNVHAHDHGLSHEMGHDIGHAHHQIGHSHKHHDDAPYGHNPADHDHQLLALMHQGASTGFPLPGAAHWVPGQDFQHLSPDGPRRPPRLG